jgi:hypothetical protein
LSLVSELLLEVINLFRCTWVFKLVDDVEEHGVLIRLLHDFSDFVVKIGQKTSSWMIDNVKERFKTNTTFSDISVEETDTNNDIGEFAKLGNLFWSSQGNKWSETGSRKYRFKGCCDFSFNGARNRWCQLDCTVVSYNMLFVFVKKVVEDFLV